MRAQCLALLVPLGVAACGGGDLTLPGPGEPARLTIVAGDRQQGQPGQPLGEPLVVEVLDVVGRPVAGAGVSFRFTDDVPEAALDPGAAPTDDQGRASARARLGMREGAQDIEALVAVDGEDLRVRFDLTALAEGDGGGGDDDGGSVPPPPPPPGGGGDGGGGGDDDGDGGEGEGSHGGADDDRGRGKGHGNRQGSGHGNGHRGDDSGAD